MGFYVTEIWNANQPLQFSDLYAPWWATHELLLHGRDPYTPTVAHEIQTVIYGEPISGNYPDDPESMGGGFAYPLIVALLMAPTVWIPFPVVRELFLGLCPAIILVSLRLWLNALRWKLDLFESVTLSFLALGSYPALQVIKLQNLSVLAACLIAAGLACIAANRLVFAGILLSIATFKPQFVVLLIPWLALWAIGDWRRRSSLAWSFIGSMTVLAMATELLLTNWPASFFKVAVAYRKYTYGHSLFDIWLTQRGGLFAAIVIVMIVGALCWKYRLVSALKAPFFLVCSLVLAATLLIIPTIEPHAQLLLFPGMLFLWHYRRPIWANGKVHRLLFVSVLCLTGWEWGAAFGLTLVSIWMPRTRLLSWWMFPLYTSPVLPLGVLLSLGFSLRANGLRASLGTERNQPG